MVLPQQDTVDEVLDRLIARLDHRWKLDGELPAGAHSRMLLKAQAYSIAELWEVLADVRTLNDLDKVTGQPLDLEAADLRLLRRHGWDDADLLWWIKLHLMLFVSGGTVPDIKRLVSYYLRRNIEDANQVTYFQGVCPICHYEEPAFYSLRFPLAWLQEENHWFRFDPNDGDGYNAAEIGGWDNGVWGNEPEEKVLKLLRFLSRATAAGVRINALGYGGLMFDPDDGDDYHASEEHGWDTSVWNGAVVEVVEDYGISQLELARYHSCVPGAKDWQDETAQMEGYEPQGFMFDPDDDDEIRHTFVHGWDVAVWVDEE